MFVSMLENELVAILEKCFDLKSSKNIISSLEALENILKMYSEKVSLIIFIYYLD